MKKHYIIRINFNEKKEQVFEGTLKEAISLQKEWGIEEENRIKLEDVTSMNDLLMIHYFGDEAIYQEVNKEEFEKNK